MRWIMRLEVRNLSKSYGKKEVLKEIDFDFESGKIYGLIGRNGSGKTTFFNCLNEDVSVDEGKFYLEDQYGRNYLNTSDIGYVISTPVVPEFLTGKEFLEFYIDINNDKGKTANSDDFAFLINPEEFISMGKSTPFAVSLPPLTISAKP